MNSHSLTFRAAEVVMLGLLAALAGCASGSLRQSTSLAPSSNVIPLSMVPANVRAPVPVSTAMPEYPYEFRSIGVDGTVNVNCLIDETGRVQDAVADTSTNDTFNQPAVDAVRRWTFQPGERDGRPVAMRVSIPIQFKLK